MRILIIALVFISSVAKGQIQDFQLKGKTPKDTLWIMGTDTNNLSTKYGLGKWYHADSLISNLAGDRDFMDKETGGTPIATTDSLITAPNVNYVQFDSAKILSYTPNFNNWYAWTQRSQTNASTNGYLANRKINFDGLSAPALTEPYGRFGEWIEQFSWDNSINAGFEDGGNLLANFGFNYDTGDPNYNDLRPGFKWSVEQGYYPGSGSTMWVESHWEHTDTLGRTFRPISIAAAYDGSYAAFSATSDYSSIFQTPDQIVGDGKWENWDYPNGTHDIWYDYHGRINNVYTGTVLEKYSNTIVAPTYRNILTHDADDDLWVGDSTGVDITNKLRFRINGYSTPLIKSNNETLQFDTVFVNFLGSSGGTNRNFTLQKVGDSDKMLFGFDGATMNVGKFNDDQAIFRIHQDAPNYSFGIRSSGKIDFNINGAYGGIDFRQFSDDLAGGWMTRDAAQSYYLGNYLDGSDHWVWNFNGNEYYRFKSNGQINATQYDATPLTGTPFRLLSHETDGDFISATWAQVVDSLEANGMTGGATDLTIGGAGPTYTIESSTGTDVTVSGTGIITLSESPANTLVIDATEVDGSATNEAWTIDGDDADTEVISNQTYKFEGAGIITTDVDAVNNKLIITGTEVDGSTTNELIEIEENNVSEGTGMLRLDFLNPFDVAVVGAEADISLDLDEVPTDADGGGAPEGDEYVVGSDGAATNEKWAITNFDLSSTNEAWTIDGDAGDTEVISNQTVLFDGTGIVSTTYTASSNTMTIAATEVDGSTTNEAWTVDGDDATTPVVVSNQTLAFRGNRGIDTDLIDGATDSISLIVDGSEWDAVTIYETDDYMQMYDSGNGKLERISQANYITELESLLTVPADGNGIYDGDGTTPTDTDVSVTDSLEFNGVLKIINDANDRVGVGSQSPEAKLHVRETAATVEAMLETTSEKVELQTKSISDGVQSPFTLSVFNKDANIDLSGDYYQMANITFSKASETTAGGSINFNIGYDSTHVDGVLTLKSRETGATDGLVNVVGGLRYKWTSSASATYTLNTGDFGLTMTTTGAKTATLPDAVTGIIGQYFSIFNNAASGDITIAITGGSGDTIYGDTVLAINESAYVTCVAANKWIINN